MPQKPFFPKHGLSVSYSKQAMYGVLNYSAVSRAATNASVERLGDCICFVFEPVPAVKKKYSSP
jgi:hypothetical protein